MSSSSLPVRTSQDGSTTINSSASDDLSDVSLLSNHQLNDRRHLEGDCPLRAGSSTSELADRGTTIDDLPDELMLEIFSYVSSSEMTSSENIKNLQEVSTRWKSLLQDPHLVHNQKYIVRYKTCEKEAIATFAAMPQLRTVILDKEVSPGVFDALSRNCPHLTTLQTYQRQMLTYSDADNLFNGCKKIRALTISAVGIRTDVRVLDAVARLAHLRVLHVRESENVDVKISLRVLADGCPLLYDLDLGNIFGLRYRIRDAEYFINSQKHVLKCLCIRLMSVEGRSIAPLLPRLETLQNLRLMNYDHVSFKVAAEALSVLGQLHSLHQLDFTVIGSEVRHLVPAVFGNGGLPNLQQLSLYGCVVNETTRALAEHCPELRELELTKCEGHTDTLFEPLCRLEKLGKLKINFCRCLRGKAMSYIAKLPALHTLEFKAIKADKLKPSVDCILEISGLRRLFFYGSVCSAIPFDKFPGRLVNLRELELDYCDGDQGVLDRICAQMPELKVEGSFGALITDSEDEDYQEDGD